MLCKPSGTKRCFSKVCAFFYLTLSITFLSLNLTSCLSVKSKQWKEPQIINKKYLDQIQQIDTYLISTNFQGSVLVARKNKVVFAKGYGSSDKKNPEAPENTIFTTFEAGSITKQLTAAAIMQLAEKRKLSVNDKISKYFPDFPYGDDITVEMLLNMHSGLTDCINASFDFFPSKTAAAIQKAQLSNTALEQDIVLKYLNQAPLFTKPNSTFFYCNTDYYLLGKIIEKITDLTYDEYIEKNILKKCGMTYSNTQFQKTDTKGYDYKGRYYSIPAELALGCGNLNSNVLDLYKWNTQLATGKVVSKKSFEKMTDSQSYGYGLYRMQDTILHGGNTNVFNSYNSYNLKNKYSVIVLVNRPINETNATIVAEKIKETFGLRTIIQKEQLED